MSRRILVAEDEQEIGQTIVRCLTSNRYLADHFDNGADAFERLLQIPYDLLILDWQMPGKSGIEICTEYRKNGGQAPVLMLTGRRELEDKEVGFGAGVDDYLTKPFSTREMLLRVEALLRRPALVSSSKLEVGQLHLEPTLHRVTLQGVEIKLSKKEFALLEFFMRHPNQIFDSEALLTRVWPDDTDSSTQTVVSYVNRLRQKLEKAGGKSSMVENVHSVGYRLRVD